MIFHLIRLYSQYIIDYLRFFAKAQTKYDIHSPFLFDFIQHIFEDNRYYYAFPLIEWQRQHLLNEKRTIVIEDHGAGSLVSKSSIRPIKDIARYGPVSPFIGQILFKIINHYQPKNSLELGTSLGVSTLYQALAFTGNTFYSVEGCPNLSQEAALTLQRLNVLNVELINETFDKAIDQLKRKIKSLDYVFIDGDHSYEGTMGYFEQLKPHLHEKSIVIIADIYWSEEMKIAWKHLKEDSKVSASIDLFRIGLLFFDSSLKHPLHIKLVKWYLKPWHIGLYR